MERPAPRLRAELRRKLGLEVTEAAAEHAFRAEIAYYLAHHLEGRDRASLDALRDRCAAVICAELSLTDIDRPAVRAAMLASLRFHPHPDAAPALATLRARGLKLVAVSNWDCSLAHVLVQAGLAQGLDAVVCSARVGAAKPDPRPFRAALQLAGCEPAAAVHVGDSLDKDVAGARAAGLAAVLIARDGASPPGVPAIRSLTELPSLIFGG